MKTTTSIRPTLPKVDQDYHVLRERMAGLLTRLAGDHVLLKLPTVKAANPDRAWQLFMYSVANDKQFDCHCCRKFIQDTYNLGYVQDSAFHSVWDHLVPPSSFAQMNSGFAGWISLRPRTQFPELWVPRNSKFLAGAETEGGFEHLFARIPKNRESLWKTQRLLDRGVCFKTETPLVLKTMEKLIQLDLRRAIDLISDKRVWRKMDNHIMLLREWLEFKDRAPKTVSEKFAYAVEAVINRSPEFIHFDNSLAGMIVQRVTEGRGQTEILAEYNRLTDPTKYQRPTVVKAGNINRAEKLVSSKGWEQSLLRRHATIQDLEKFALWKPVGKPTGTKMVPKAGIFDSVRADSPWSRITKGTVRFFDFIRNTAPRAMCMEIQAPDIGAFFGFTAPVDPTAPPLVRYPGGVAQWTYTEETTPEEWGLRQQWIEVLAIVPFPEQNQRGLVDKVMFIARGKHSGPPGLALFPETLVPEAREIRSTIEAYSAKNRLAGVFTVVGIPLQDGPRIQIRVDRTNLFHIGM
jgi:hypothetical protein